jgi:5-bromo-4-chloroindolyl phosphate hydrolysis protein
MIKRRKFEPAPVDDEIKPLDLDMIADGMLSKGRALINELDGLDDEIKNVKINADINELKTVSLQIFDYLDKNPTDAKKARDIVEYYLPTAISLLRTYRDTADGNVHTDEMDDAMKKIDMAMQNIILVFERQLDSFYTNKALDVSSDIDVLKSMLRRDGLDSDKE